LELAKRSFGKLLMRLNPEASMHLQWNNNKKHMENKAFKQLTGMFYLHLLFATIKLQVQSEKNEITTIEKLH